METRLEGYMDRDYDLDALCTAAERLLRASGIEPGDERVNAYPDKRTVRYYQTLGLIPKPVRYEGRRAVYDADHLLRVVCVKLLQSEGQSLSQVQRAIPAATRAQLELAIGEALLHPTATSTAFEQAPALEPKKTRGRDLICRELAPGVFVTIDPQRVAQPKHVLAQILAALSSGETS